MTQHARRRATYEDLFGLPENLVGEIIDGVLHTHPRPVPRHARASSSLGMEIGTPFDREKGGPGGWWILDEPELHLGADILVPDLAGWRRECMPELPETAWFEIVPDWTCEVLSPSTLRTDRALKMPKYAHHGVCWLWLIDPDTRILEAFELHQGRWSLIATLTDDERVRVRPFDAIEFGLDALWA
jgi:Uma2 family endonuclease